MKPYFESMLPELLPVTEEEIEAVSNALRSVPLTTMFGGCEIEAFEREFASLFDAPHAVAVTSGTTALHAALLAAEIGPGDEVIVTPFSFVASVSVVVQVGATPVFADVDPQTFVMDPVDVARKITPRTRAILPVHQCGYPVDMRALCQVVEGKRIVIIEDSAAAHGAMVSGRAVGTIGDFGCFSFNIGKILRTGEGGMVLARSEDMDRRLRAIRVNGLIPTPQGTWVDRLGTNYTMMHSTAAFGRVQVRNFHKLALRRRQIGERIREGIEGLGASAPPDRPNLIRAYYSTPFLLAPELARFRDEIVDGIRAHNVPASRGNPQLLHQIDYIKKLSPTKSCPVAEAVRPRIFFFDPLPSLTDEQVEGVVSVFRLVLERYAARIS